jgi:hypothetical protein
MDNALNQTPVMNSNPNPSLRGEEKAFNDLKEPNQEVVKSKLTKKVKSISTIIGLTLFFVGAMAAILISQRQRIAREPVAPNAPASQPSADVVGSGCTLRFTVGDLQCNSPCDPLADTDSCTEINEDYSCEEIEIDDTTENRCRLTSNPSSEICEQDYACDSSCDPLAETDACTEINEDYSCEEVEISGETEDRCRLTSYPESETCEEPDSTPTPTPTPTDGPTATPTPTLPPGVTATPTPTLPADATATPTPEGWDGSQPILPETLPESGPEDWLNYLKVGIGAIGVGALLILFL